MAIEHRGSRTYFYTAQREGKRVVKRYWGNGDVAGSMALLAEQDKERVRIERLLERAKREEEETLQREWKRIADLLTETVAALLTQAGYHRRDWGPWRLKRNWSLNDCQGVNERLGCSKEAGKKEMTNNDLAIPETQEERMTVLRKGLQSENAKDKERAVAVLKACPDVFRSSFLNEVNTIITRLTGDEAMIVQLYQNEAELMRTGLYDGRDAEQIPYAERLLIERVIACRFALVKMENSASETNISLVQAEYRQRCVDRANRRYLQALKAYAEVRRLALPVICLTQVVINPSN